MIDIQVLRVFTGPDGEGGNALAVVPDGAAVRGDTARRELAARLGHSETVFVDDAERGVVDIWTPSVRLPFAGHPLVGVGWLLGAEVLRPPAGEVRVHGDGEFTWVRGRAAWAAGRHTERYASPAEVDALPAPPEGEGWLYAWAWQDERAGRVRARGFPRRGDGIAEDEATGAAALTLTDRLGRALDIRQGAASQILARPRADGTIDIGGRVAPGTAARAG
ncbi:PhzF family phenazine biosynthesis protein [Streptomyces sp. NPDC051173]|uniref:PhzF family phenazine biosynthesis protein n=1 Tax=Streptomyces sp. NPDC051173 TaxID=3155164 RepID=UPI00344ECFB1